jgi:hypothetical protein
MDRSAVSSEPTRLHSCAKVAPSQRETLPQARSRAELEVWENEGGTANQPLGPVARTAEVRPECTGQGH